MIFKFFEVLFCDLFFRNIERLCSGSNENKIPPAFTQKPKLQSVHKSETAKFICSFVASPRPDVIWLHSDNAIKVQQFGFIKCEQVKLFFFKLMR